MVAASFGDDNLEAAETVSDHTLHRCSNLVMRRNLVMFEQGKGCRNVLYRKLVRSNANGRTNHYCTYCKVADVMMSPSNHDAEESSMILVDQVLRFLRRRRNSHILV
jgi:hypothetical protein